MKYLIVIVAILGVFAIQGEAIRKCFPIRLLSTNVPTVAPTTVAPITTVAINLTQIAILQNNVSALTTYTSTQNSQLLSTAFTLVSKAASLKNDTTTPATAQPILTQITSMTVPTARRKRQANIFDVPETCEEAVETVSSLNTQLQAALIYDPASLMDFLAFINSSLSTVTPMTEGLDNLQKMVVSIMNLLSESTTLFDNLAAAIMKLLPYMDEYSNSLCSLTTPTAADYTGTTAVIDLGTKTCTLGGTIYDVLDETISFGIEAGTGLDGKPIYVGHMTFNSITYPGGLALAKSLAPGLYYTRDNRLIGMTQTNVTYLQHGTCNCYFIDRDTALPSNTFLVSLNSGANQFGIGRFLDTTTMTYSYTVLGRIKLSTMTMYYLDFFSLSEKTTTTFDKLICENAQATTTVAPTPTDPSDYPAAIISTMNSIGTIIGQKNTIEQNIVIKNEAVKLLLATTLAANATLNLTSTDIAAILDVTQAIIDLNFQAQNTTSTFVNPLSVCPSAMDLITPVSSKFANTLDYLKRMRSFVATIQNVLAKTWAAYAASAVIAQANPFLGTIVGYVKDYIRLFKELMLKTEEGAAQFNTFMGYMMVQCYSYFGY